MKDNMIGTVVQVRRYPVKSLLGEQITSAEVDARGLVGDRLWAVREPDGRLGSGKTTRRFRRMDGLLELAARSENGLPVVEFSDSSVLRADDEQVHEALSRHVGRPVTLAREDAVSHLDEGPVHLVTSATLHRLGEVHGTPVDVRRLRANLLVETPGLEGFAEDGWVGRDMTIGPHVVLRVRAPMPRCVMVGMAHSDLPDDRGLLSTVTTANAMAVGVVLDVVSGGTVTVGDVVNVG